MKIQLLFIALLMFAFSYEASAVNSLVTKDGAVTSLTKDAQKTNIFQKAGNWWKATKMKVATKIAKRLSEVDFEDPAFILKVAIAGLVLGFVLWMVGWLIFWPISYIGSLCWGVGSLALLWWIYLKYIK